MTITRVRARATGLALALSIVFLIAAAPARSSAATCAVPSGSYATIASAISDTDCAAIDVASGTYDEALDITRSVAIHGAGSGVSTIAPTSQPGEVVGIHGSGVDVELDGFTIRYASGHYVPSYPSVQSIGVHVYGSASANVHDNTITEIHNDNSNGNQTGHCVMVGVSSPASTGTIILRSNTITYCGKQGVTVRANSTATIDNNVVAHGNQGDGKDPLQNQASNGIVLYPGVSSTVTNNQVFDWKCPVGTGGAPPNGCAHSLDGVQSLGILVFGAQTSFSMSGNTISDTDGAYFDYEAGAGPWNFSDNAFHDNIVFNASIYGAGETWSGNTLDGAMYGLVLYGDTTPTSVQLAGGNTIENATVQGVYTDASGGDVNINGSKNSFVGNAGGIDTSGATSASLKCNWWGSSDGPTVAGNPDGNGDDVSGNTDWTRFSTNDDAFDCGTITPTLAYGAASVNEGESTTLTLTLTNDDVGDVGPASVSFALPAGFTATAVQSSDCSGSVDISSPGVPSVAGVQLTASGSCTVVLTVVAGSAGGFTTTIPAGGVIAPNGNSPSAASAAITVLAHVTPEPPTPPVTPVDPIPACYDGRVIITDVRRSGTRVIIVGYGHTSDSGRAITVRSKLSGRVVARPVIAADGSWRANVAAPPRSRWGSNDARYRASLGSSSTIWTKMTRRMGTTTVSYSNGRLSVSGSASRPLARGARASVQASYDCGSYRALGRLNVSSAGRFNGNLAAPTSTSVFFVRVRVSVRNSNGLVYSTYSIVQPVIPR
ncbi:MAG: right-handed parallel beta-helix repeat-containing protein [Solirubrobacterales bacterium]